MTFRLRPLHEDKLHFADLSNTQILILALEASQKIKWNIEEITLREVRFMLRWELNLINKNKYESIYTSETIRKRKCSIEKMPVDFPLLLPVYRS